MDADGCVLEAVEVVRFEDQLSRKRELVSSSLLGFLNRVVSSELTYLKGWFVPRKFSGAVAVRDPVHGRR